MMKKNDRLIENIRQILDQSLDELDATTRSRLTLARHLAIERQEKRRIRLFYWGSVPAVALLLVVLLLNWQVVPVKPVIAPQVDDLSILTAAEPLEFFQEEIEFYEWLSEELEVDKELSDSGSRPVSPFAESFACAGEQFAGTAESRTARLSGVI